MTDDSSGRAGAAPLPFRVAFVPGVTLSKWSRVWEQRMNGLPLVVVPIEEADQLDVLRGDQADISFVRLPVDRDGLNLIPLYHEVPVVVVSKEHPVAVYDEVSVAELADEHLLQDPDDVPSWRDIAVELRDGTRLDVPPMTTKEAIEVVASGGGIVIVPKSVARLYGRKDVVARPVSDVADSQIGLAWLADAADARIETFIGIVRGRTERSSRAGGVPRGAQKTVPKRPVEKLPRQRRAPRPGTGNRTRRRGAR